MSRPASYLLNVAYAALLFAALPLLLWAMVRKGKYREGYAAKLLGRVPRRERDRPCFWLHAVSVGEVNVLRTLVAELAARWPDVDLVVSTTTKTGYDLARRRFADRSVFYCPLDFSWAVRTAMRRIRPKILVLAELELWPNLVRAAKESGAAVAIVNGRVSDHSYRGYRRVRPVIASVLRQIDVIAAQDETTADRFRALGARAETVHVSGSLKYDGAETDRGNERTQTLRAATGFEDRDIVFLAGSTQEPEEAIVLRTFQTLAAEQPRLKLVIVPRHPERFDEVARLLEKSSFSWHRRSTLGHGQLQNGESAPQLLLVDTVGELGAWWGAAQIGFVGGSLGSRGGQNMIEPAAFGVATSFGPNTRNFRDIVASLLGAEGAVVVRDGAELTTFVRRCLEEPGWAESLGRSARQFVQTQLGATKRTADLLDRLPRSPGPAQSKPRSAA